MRGFFGLFLVGAALLSCGAWAAPRPKAKRGPPVLLVQPGLVRPGDVVSITVVAPPAKGVAEGTLGGRRLQFHPVKGGFRALFPVSVEQPPSTLELEVVTLVPQGAAGKRKRSLRRVARHARVEVIAPGFPRRELRVARKFTEPTPGLKRQMSEDRQAFQRAYAQRDRPPLFTRTFEWPRRAALTAPFGDLRTFNGKKQSQHLGIDLQGAVGEPIYATNDGVVVLVRDAHASGRTVLVYHGARLYSAYFHLSSAEVKEGQRLKRGQRIGKVGKSGRVTGPHLHFAIKLDGLYVDPVSLLRLRF